MGTLVAVLAVVHATEVDRVNLGAAPKVALHSAVNVVPVGAAWVDGRLSAPWQDWAGVAPVDAHPLHR